MKPALFGRPVSFVKGVTPFPSFERKSNPNRNHKRPQLNVTYSLGGADAPSASLLFGVQPTDTVTIAFVIATITAVAVVAGWLPAWRASRLDPNVVLRDE